MFQSIANSLDSQVLVLWQAGCIKPSLDPPSGPGWAAITFDSEIKDHKEYSNQGNKQLISFKVSGAYRTSQPFSCHINQSTTAYLAMKKAVLLRCKSAIVHAFLSTGVISVHDHCPKQPGILWPIDTANDILGHCQQVLIAH